MHVFVCVYVQKDGREKKQKDIKRKEKQKQAYYIVLTMSDSLFREATVLQTRVPNSTQLHTHTYKTSANTIVASTLVIAPKPSHKLH